jgi:hypothetical protein
MLGLAAQLGFRADDEQPDSSTRRITLALR